MTTTVTHQPPRAAVPGALRAKLRSIARQYETQPGMGSDYQRGPFLELGDDEINLRIVIEGDRAVFYAYSGDFDAYGQWCEAWQFQASLDRRKATLDDMSEVIEQELVDSGVTRQHKRVAVVSTPATRTDRTPATDTVPAGGESTHDVTHDTPAQTPPQPVSVLERIGGMRKRRDGMTTTIRGGYGFAWSPRHAPHYLLPEAEWTMENAGLAVVVEKAHVVAVNAAREYRITIDDNPLLSDADKDALAEGVQHQLEEHLRAGWQRGRLSAESGVGFNWLSSRTEAWV